MRSFSFMNQESNRQREIQGKPTPRWRVSTPHTGRSGAMTACCGTVDRACETCWLQLLQSRGKREQRKPYNPSGRSATAGQSQTARPWRVDPLKSGSSGNVDRFDLSATVDTRHLGGARSETPREGPGRHWGARSSARRLKGGTPAGGRRQEVGQCWRGPDRGEPVGTLPGALDNAHTH